MENFHVVVAYDLSSKKSDNDAWTKFKDSYKKHLLNGETYPDSTAVFSIGAETVEEAKQKVKEAIKKWLSEIRNSGTDISISKFFIAQCAKEEVYNYN